MDEQYAYRLMNYMKGRAGVPYEIMVFTDRGSLDDFLKSNEAEVLITNNEEVIREVPRGKIHYILKLSEEELAGSVGESTEYHPIFKYQSTEAIIREMLSYCAGEVYLAVNNLAKRTKGKIIGVYSPVGRCYKTTFSLAIANVLGKSGNVLYINLEEYTGLSDSLFQGNRSGLSEVMYMYRRNAAGLRLKLHDHICSMGKFDCILPVECPDDVADILVEEWITFFQYLLDVSEYDYLVIDVGTIVKKPWHFFERMNVVFMPEAEDFVAQKKIGEFYEHMNITGRGILLENVVKILIPYDKEFSTGKISVDKMEWSSLGSFARKVLNERGF
ncbi:MAG: hypothetical protein NC086_02065 [Alistipes sp.]|nr:hypothetical protein [Alistipes sp.]